MPILGTWGHTASICSDICKYLLYHNDGNSHEKELWFCALPLGFLEVRYSIMSPEIFQIKMSWFLKHHREYCVVFFFLSFLFFFVVGSRNPSNIRSSYRQEICSTASRLNCMSCYITGNINLRWEKEYANCCTSPLRQLTACNWDYEVHS